jgi:hypothetical protein
LTDLVGLLLIKASGRHRGRADTDAARDIGR